MTKLEVMSRLKTLSIMPVVRAGSDQLALDLVSALASGGIDVVEITMTVPSALNVIARVTRERSGMIVGAGTVLDSETARICILEGAQFIVSPHLNIKVIEICLRYGVAIFPGALTPTEIMTAWQAGADAVKVFPVSAVGGAAYLRSIKAPLPHIELIPSGGVNLHSAESFLEAGALALGIGAELADCEAVSNGRAGDVTAAAVRYVKTVRDHRLNARSR